MRRLACAAMALSLFLASPTLGAETLREFACQPRAVEGTVGRATTTTVLTVTEPGVTARRYALSGRVRYEGIAGRGYLEMWSHFPGKGKFFARTLGQEAMQPLSGSSGWRYFSLPFFITDHDFPAPERLVLNVVLDGRGRVEMGTVHLMQFGEDEDPTRLPGQWWDESTAALLGGLFGAVTGCMGALIGVLSARGRAQRLVLGMMRLLLVLGVAALGLGIYAFVISQPYAVYYPLLLLGGLLVAIIGGLYRQIRNRYAEIEIRRMQAQDG